MPYGNNMFERILLFACQANLLRLGHAGRPICAVNIAAEQAKPFITLSILTGTARLLNYFNTILKATTAWFVKFLRTIPFGRCVWILRHGKPITKHHVP